MGGADGISEMTRQWVHVVESSVGRDAHSVEVWSLDDHTRRYVSERLRRSGPLGGDGCDLRHSP
jgi:hypothetical protein